MHLLDRARMTANLGAVDISRRIMERYLKRQFVNQLKSHDVNLVLDIGANSGQYGLNLRKSAYKGRIISFEPLSEPFSALEAKAAVDPLWDCHRYALGDVDGTVSVNVAGNAAESSSILPMLKAHQDIYPPANYVGAEDVPIYRLDSVAQQLLRPTDRFFVKIDVQGFEKQVLAGSVSTLNDACVGLQLELSFLPLYDGAMLIREALDLADSLGFTLMALRPCFIDPRDGRMLQADGIFFREEG